MYKTSRSCVHLQSGVTGFFSVHLGVKQGNNLILIYLRSVHYSSKKRPTYN
jgi:hypothetical protein